MPIFTGTVRGTFPVGPPTITANFNTNPFLTLPLVVGQAFTISGAAHPQFNGTWTTLDLFTLNVANDSVHFTMPNAAPGSGLVFDNNVTLNFDFMPTIGCDLTTLVNDAKCFQCFSEKQNMAALVYFLEQVRAKKAGVTARTPNQLRTATAGLANFPVDPVADAADVAVAQQWAVNAGVAGASTQTIDAINKAIVQFSNMSLDDLRTIEILIRCNLSSL